MNKFRKCLMNAIMTVLSFLVYCDRFCSYITVIISVHFLTFGQVKNDDASLTTVSTLCPSGFEWLKLHLIPTSVTGQTGAPKAFYISNGRHKNQIQVFPRGNVMFGGRLYKGGSRLVFYLQPYQIVFLQSMDVMSGTKIVSQYPIFLTIGLTYINPGKSSSCIQVT